MQILLVEDDPFIARAVTAALESEAHVARWVPTGREALTDIRTSRPDAVLLDLGLPGMDGIDVLRAIRAMPSPVCDLPVIIVTAREALESRLEGLDAGADDYILKPFHMSELLARLRAVVRRKGPLAGDVLRAGGLSLNTVTHTCTADGRAVTLSKREYALLAALLQRPGAILSRRQLEEKLYAPGDEPESNAVEYLIHALRRKIGADAVENIRGLGWRIRDAA
ncbi:MAG: response regulator transcription factor [Sutterella sp.]|nr:response regulator transcription factor [Sutterella sp.]